jgi:dynein heavy chain
MKNSMIRNQECIELWVKVQKSWQYLQPIFASDDIQKAMPGDSNKFESIDKHWVSIMSQTEKLPIVNDACNLQKIMENFQWCSTAADTIIKNLNDYLNTKRDAFPRFYFLPNEELLMILAQTREVKMIQRF